MRGYGSIDPQAEQENAEDAANLENDDQDDNFPEESEYSTLNAKRQRQSTTTSGTEKCVFKIPTIPSSTEERNNLFQSVRNLTYEQRVVFDMYIHYFQSIRNVQHGGDIMPEPPRVIVQGKYFHKF